MRISDWSSDVCSSDLETRTSEGFHLPHIDEPGLQDLYAWNAEILSLALRSRRAADEPAGCRSKLDDLLAAAGGDAAAASAELFARIAERSSTIEHHRRSEERRVGQECVSTCRSRLSP